MAWEDEVVEKFAEVGGCFPGNRVQRCDPWVNEYTKQVLSTDSLKTLTMCWVGIARGVGTKNWGQDGAEKWKSGKPTEMNPGKLKTTSGGQRSLEPWGNLKEKHVIW